MIIWSLIFDRWIIFVFETRNLFGDYSNKLLRAILSVSPLNKMISKFNYIFNYVLFDEIFLFSLYLIPFSQQNPFLGLILNILKINFFDHQNLF